MIFCLRKKNNFFLRGEYVSADDLKKYWGVRASRVLRKLADEFGLKGTTVDNTSKDPRSFSASWVLLTNNQDFLQNPNILNFSKPRPVDMPDLRLWTDDYSNLFQILY